jgi:hypothetical protein
MVNIIVVQMSDKVVQNTRNLLAHVSKVVELEQSDMFNL